MQSGSTPEIKDNFSDMETPNAAEMQVQLEQLVQQGSLSPEQAQAFLQENSAMEGVTLDPKARQAQDDALSRLSEITSSGGLTASDKASLGQIQLDEQTKARGSREAILQNAQARGVGGSGLEMMSQMQNQQDSATRASQRDLGVAAQGQDRALQALIQQGQLGSQVGAQRFDQGAQKASATDAISRFNTQNKQQVGNMNVAARNDAAGRNLGAQQAIADTNVDIRNKNQLLGKSAIQQQYENELKKRQGQSGVASANAQNAGADSTASANANNQTVGTGISAAAMFASDERVKEDVQDFSAGDFLDSLAPKKFKYKDPSKHGVGSQVGVMAQDLEKTEAGSKMVSQGQDGVKMVDYNKAGPAMLASMADLHKRLKKKEQE